jgi:hypothetical protein
MLVCIEVRDTDFVVAVKYKWFQVNVLQGIVTLQNS